MFATYVQETDEDGDLVHEWATITDGHPTDNPQLDYMLGSYGTNIRDARNANGYGTATFRSEARGRLYEITWVTKEKFYAEYFRPDIRVMDATEEPDPTAEFRTP